MKKIYTLFVAFLFVIIVSAQPCPDSLYLTSQAQVDSFQILYPNCTEIEGNVFISGNDITNLDGLTVLTSIGGYFWIWYNYALTSLTGLDNVTSIGGYLWISGKGALTSLTGLDNVTSIGGNLYLWDNYVLTSLTGLENVTSIGGKLYITHNHTLTSLTGLDNVTSIGGYLWISSNYALTSLTGLENIEAESIEDLKIENNPYLSYCSVLSICNYLSNPNGTVEILDNTTGCDNPEEVQDSCIANGVNINEQFVVDKLLIYPNPSSNHITIELHQKPQKNTSLIIYNLNGQQLITQPITEPQTVVDISGLPSGVYFIKVKDDEKVMMEKVIKE